MRSLIDPFLFVALLADVNEFDKPNPQSVGQILRVANKYTYHDLDELIVSHIKSTVRKIEELMNHEKFKGKTQGELRTSPLFPCFDSSRPFSAEFVKCLRLQINSFRTLRWPTRASLSTLSASTEIDPDTSTLPS